VFNTAKVRLQRVGTGSNRAVWLTVLAVAAVSAAVGLTQQTQTTQAQAQPPNPPAQTITPPPPSAALTAQPVIPPAQADEDKQIVDTAPSRIPPASSVKFRKELNLPFPSLNTLGTRIDAARRTADPVTLSNTANELRAAELLSGKTASLTSKQLITEAAELAMLRRQEAEMRAVLNISDQVALEQANVAALKNMLALKQQEKRGFERNEEPLGLPRKILINNHTDQYIELQVNGHIRGQVQPSSSMTLVIDQPWNPIVLKGWGDGDDTTFGPVILKGRFSNYTWNINQDDAFFKNPRP
jgi:hypothetical protein